MRNKEIRNILSTIKTLVCHKIIVIIYVKSQKDTE